MALPLYGYPAPFSDMKNIIILVLVDALIILISFIIIYFIKKDKDDIDSTIKKAKKILSEGRNEDILTLRKKENWSRSLWLEGKPYARLELGEIAKRAAINIPDRKNLAEIYIDDLGWTSVSLEKYSNAKDFLQQGLKCAEQIQDNDDKYYWSAKAKRHVAGIEVECRNYNEAEKLMEMATSYCNRIVNEQKKNEMLAGIYYGQSIIFLKASNDKKENLEIALDYAEKSEMLRKGGDKTRLVKIHSLKGNIYEAKNDKVNAEEQYRKGLEESRDRRIDEIIKNYLGLARIIENNDEKRQCIKSAKKLLDKTPVPYLIDEKEMKLIQIHGKE
ncbi:hypothetical protein AGMMS49959_15090 [Planctomycetales bacterium]|nr:hypothetical protein AGMMS49959_15090 [Planctomycetales bacterium]